MSEKRVPLTGTVTNTDVQTQYLTTPRWAGNSGTLSIQVVIARTSGTLAGTVTPEYSLDGTNFIAIPGTSAFTMSNAATNSHIWSITDRKALYYRLNVTTSGTVVAKSFAIFLEDNNPA